MNSKEKLDYFLTEILEVARINPIGLIFIEYIPILDIEGNGGIPDEAPIIISATEKRNMLFKFEQDGLIMTFGEENNHRGNPRGAWIALTGIDRDQTVSPYSLSKSGTQIVDEDTDLDRGVLRVENQLVQLSTKAGKENNPLRLVKTLMKEPSKYWFEDEILEDWDGVGFETRKSQMPKNQIYHSAKNLNKKIQEVTGISDYIEHDTSKFRINPKYLNNL